LSGTTLPANPLVQIAHAVEAVCRSWTAPRAREYRRLNKLDSPDGTAVIVQMMVFGNASGASGSGVGFTRDPTDGTNALYVDFLFKAQGDDVVQGRETATDSVLLPRLLPGVQAELTRAKGLLESAFGDMQDFEFTVQRGRLYFLQTRSGKRTPWAALRIAADLVAEGVIDSATALKRLADIDLDSIQRSRLEPDGAHPIGIAIPAGFGVAVGAVALDVAKARQMSADGPVILVRPDISTDDIAGIAASAGIVTARGSRTSHAAVVARQMGKACVVGCAMLQVDAERRSCRFGDLVFHEGDAVTVDSAAGRIYAGRLAVVTDRPLDALAAVESWRAIARP
jgi:pyruvate,orthophosphate dikinase